MRRQIVLYTKPGCHLCENARGDLAQLETEFELSLQAIDITTDHALFKEYFDKIPVLIIDERVTLAAPFSLQDVRRALNSG